MEENEIEERFKEQLPQIVDEINFQNELTSVLNKLDQLSDKSQINTSQKNQLIQSLMSLITQFFLEYKKQNYEQESVQQSGSIEEQKGEEQNNISNVELEPPCAIKNQLNQIFDKLQENNNAELESNESVEALRDYLIQNRRDIHILNVKLSEDAMNLIKELLNCVMQIFINQSNILRKALSEKQTECFNLQMKSQKDDNELDSLNKKIAKLDDDDHKFHQNYQKLDIQLRDKEEELKTFKEKHSNEVKILQSSQKIADNEIKSLKENAKAREEKMTSQNIKYEELYKENINLQIEANKVKACELEAQSLQQQLQTELKQNINFKNTLSGERSSIQKLTEEIAILRVFQQQLESEKINAIGNWEISQRKLEQVSHSYDQLISQYNQNKQKIENLNDDLNHLKSQGITCQQQSKEIEELRQKLNHNREDVKKLFLEDDVSEEVISDYWNQEIFSLGQKYRGNYKELEKQLRTELVEIQSQKDSQEKIKKQLFHQQYIQKLIIRLDEGQAELERNRKDFLSEKQKFEVNSKRKAGQTFTERVAWSVTVFFLVYCICQLWFQRTL